MRYAGIKVNDVIDGVGISVSFWTQGCPHRCLNCHNPETWDYDKGIEDTEINIINKITNALNKNNIQRNLSILGGEPLCLENIHFVDKLISVTHTKAKYIFLWTGYELKELFNIYEEKWLNEFLQKINVLITGRYIHKLRDIQNLPLRGSSNQKIVLLNPKTRKEITKLFLNNNIFKNK